MFINETDMKLMFFIRSLNGWARNKENNVVTNRNTQTPSMKQFTKMVKSCPFLLLLCCRIPFLRKHNFNSFKNSILECSFIYQWLTKQLKRKLIMYRQVQLLPRLRTNSKWHFVKFYFSYEFSRNTKSLIKFHTCTT